MKISKALKVKNRMIQAINKIDSDIRTYNTINIIYRNKERPEHLFTKHTPSLINKRELIVKALIAIKAAIAKANVPINSKIYEMAEKKALLTVLQSVNCSNDKSAFGEDMVREVVAQIGIVHRDDMIASIEKEISMIQDDLDIYNASTNIDDVDIPSDI